MKPFGFITLFLLSCGFNQATSLKSKKVCHCVSSASCYDTEETIKIILEETPLCRECLLEHCGHLDSNDLKGFTLCLIKIRSQCSKCANHSRSIQSRINNCKTCYDKCSHSSKASSSVQAPPPASSSSCHQICSSFKRCPSSNEILSTIANTSETCRNCTEIACGNYTALTKNKIAYCMYDAREQCSGCILSSTEQQQRKVCMACKSKCEATPKQPSIEVGVAGFQSRNKQQRCRGICTKPGACPTTSQIISTFENDPQQCRRCVVFNCGEYKRSNKQSVANCMYHARSACIGCNISLSAKRERQNCRSCFLNCARRLGRVSVQSLKVSPVSPSKQTSCSKGCLRLRVCPSTSQIIYTIERQTKPCRDCITNKCGGYAKNNRTTVADCMFQSRVICNECELNVAVKKQREKCKRCHAACIGKEETRNLISSTPAAAMTTVSTSAGTERDRVSTPTHAITSGR